MSLALAFGLYCVGFMIILERLLAMLVESLGKLMVSGSQGWMMRGRRLSPLEEIGRTKRNRRSVGTKCGMKCTTKCEMGVKETLWRGSPTQSSEEPLDDA